MKGRQRFAHAILTPLKRLVKKAIAEDPQATRRWIGEVLRGVEDAATKSPRSLRRDDHVIVRLAQGWSEVSRSFETLEMIATLARRAPTKRLGVNAEAQLRFLVEAYLNEVYIFSERVKALLATVRRTYRKDPRASSIERGLRPIAGLLDRTLKRVVGIRGFHVHEARHDDFDVGRLGTLRLLASSEPEVRRLFDIEVRRIRRVKARLLQDNNRAIARLLDLMCDDIFPLVFDADAQLRLPGPTIKAG